MDREDIKCGHLKVDGHIFHSKDKVNVTLKGTNFQAVIEGGIILIDDTVASIYYNDEQVKSSNGDPKRHGTGSRCPKLADYPYYWKIAEKRLALDDWKLIPDFYVKGSLKPCQPNLDNVEIF